jgi:hypothetical protein
MHTSPNNFAVVLALLSSAFVLPACHRLDDPPAPLAPRGLSVLGFEEQHASPREIVVESAPIIVKADPHGAIVTAADVVELHESPAAEELSLDLRYDPANETTLRGPVVGKRFVKLDDGYTAEVATVMVGDTQVDAMLATTEFSFHNNIDVGITDRVLMRGHMVKFEGRDMMLVRELTYRGNKIELRNEKGWPVWREGETAPNAISGLSAVKGPTRTSLWW